MSFDHKERNGARFGGVYTSNLMKDRGPVLRREERFLEIEILDISRSMEHPLRSTARITRRLIETSRVMIVGFLSCDHD